MYSKAIASAYALRSCLRSVVNGFNYSVDTRHVYVDIFYQDLDMDFYTTGGAGKQTRVWKQAMSHETGHKANDIFATMSNTWLSVRPVTS
jgi:hypothetical protein